MKTSLWLRVASAISFVLAVGHTLGGRGAWSPLGDNAVLRAMGTFRFDAMGASRTYLDFYLGFGFLLSVYLLLQAVVLWQLATRARTEPARTRPLVATFLLASLASAALGWQFLFVVPVIFSGVIAVCLAGALVAAGRGKAA